jgi:small conductance mechanosensitive channel
METVSFAAILAAASLATGLILQGYLSNFAGGIWCLIFKSYNIGDLIEPQEGLGAVKEIDVIVIKLVTPKNKWSTIPSGLMTHVNNIHYTAKGKMSINTPVRIGYGENMKKTKDALLAMLESNPKALKDLPPCVNVSKLGDSSVHLIVRPYC